MRATTVIVGLVALLVLGAFVWWLLSEEEGRSDVIMPPNGAITITGEIVCLPHRDTTGPQTLECAYGLLGDDGNHYMLRDETVGTGPSAITTIPTGSPVEVTGTFAQGESDIYASVGTITVDTVYLDNGADNAESETHSDGIITFTRLEGFGLAVSEQQILVDSVVPPCESGFEYCLYYLENMYEDTNFESAGVAIRTRDDLANENECLATPPDGYTNISPVATASGDLYAMSMFPTLTNAATGHYSNHREHRLYVSNTCYEFTERIGESQFENFPTGTIQEFTDDDRTELFERLRTVVESIALNETGETLVLPVE